MTSARPGSTRTRNDQRSPSEAIAHSFSPLIHNAALQERSFNAVYVPFRVPSEMVADFVEDVPRLGINALSVTIPHKETFAAYLTKVDPADARR